MGRLVGKELVSVLERDRRHSWAAVDRVDFADVVEDMDEKGEERRSLGFEEEASSSLAEEGIGLEAGCSLVEEDTGFAAGADCSSAVVGSLLLDSHLLRHNSLSSTCFVFVCDKVCKRVEVEMLDRKS